MMWISWNCLFIAMGDTSNSVTEENVEKTPEIQESMTNALRPAKPSENIAISEATPLTSEEELEKIHEIVESEENLKEADAKNKRDEPEKTAEPIAIATAQETTPVSETSPVTETTPVCEKPSPTSVEPPAPVVLEKKPRAGSAATGLNQNDRLLRNQSDIFSLKEQTSVTSSIFSINGSPSRKVSRKREPIPFGGHPFEPPSDKAAVVSKDRLRDRESYSDMGHPTSSLRNPLTGTGLSSNDEYKFKSNKRKDGNPLLGLGYDPEVVPSGHRVPPGGFSHKLW